MSGPAIITELARAKVNLTLHVGRVIADPSDAYFGYHPLDSLVVFADIADELSAAPADNMSLTISGPFGGAIDNGADNLILKAIAKTAEHAAVPPLAITLKKNLPVAAGIGGGSANAAAMLRILQNYAELPAKIWQDIALSLGADVPVCLLSKSAHMTGIGEGAFAVDGLGAVPAVLVNPGAPVPTGPVFKAFDSQSGPNAPRETPRPQMISGDMLARTLDGRNDLEPPATAQVPIISDVLREIASQKGALAARMSGSGATCFGLFERKAQAELAAQTISKAYPKWWVRAAIFGESG